MRALVAAHARTQLSPEQQARDPLPPMGAPGGAPARLGWALAWIIGSLAVHGAVVLAGVALGGGDRGRREVIRQEVKIEVRETKVVPPPPPVEKPPEPEQPVVKPKLAKVEPPPKEPPPKEPKAPPPRVVGLSLESTVEGGGDGPAFAVGNTRMGETAERAADPKAVAPVAAPTAPIAAPTANQAATRIPVAGVKYTPVAPRGGSMAKPPYPKTLETQGIEADVKVMIGIDAAGNVTSVKILNEAPYPEFNEAARRAALAQKFEPATRDETPIATTLSFTYRFRLEDQ
jgi:TonB family protein